MRCALQELTISGTWADALFASGLQRSEEPSPGQVRRAVAAAMAAWGEVGCAARVAQAYGEDPETAVTRMRWACTTVAGTYRQVTAISAESVSPSLRRARS